MKSQVVTVALRHCQGSLESGPSLCMSPDPWLMGQRAKGLLEAYPPQRGASLAGPHHASPVPFLPVPTQGLAPLSATPSLLRFASPAHSLKPTQGGKGHVLHSGSLGKVSGKPELADREEVEGCSRQRATGDNADRFDWSMGARGEKG